MNQDIDFSSHKLGALIDPTVDPRTIGWIESLAVETLVRDAAVSLPPVDADFRNLVNRLLTGGVEMVVFLTAAGLKQFLERAERFAGERRLKYALEDIQTITVGGLVTSTMQNWGVTPTLAQLDNVSWRDVLVRLDRECSLDNVTVGLESTADVHGISAGLEARGAEVLRIDSPNFSYRDPSASEQDILDAIEDGELGTLLFPNPICAARFVYLLNIRERAVLARNSSHLVILALGKETEELLSDRGLPADVVLDDQQVKSEVQHAMQVVRHHRTQSEQQLSGPASPVQDTQAPWYNSPFMKAVRGEPTDVTPVWMMRQAGRYMQEYREVREKTPFLDLCKNPQLCSEVMCTAVARLGVDAAIIFSDLLPILEPMGSDLEFVAGDGPVIHNPLRSAADVDRVRRLDSLEPLQFVMDTVTQTRADLPADMPLIGFAGAPFSLASYMIEGGSTKNYAATKQLMFGDAGAWHELMDRLVSSITLYLQGQVAAGAQCIQLFDSWAGCLAVADYRKYVLPHTEKIIEAIAPLAPVINFATGNPALLPCLSNTPAQVIGIDWRIDLATAWETVGWEKSVQGNLDPTVLLTDLTTIREKVRAVLDEAGGRPGHIFNLGHGILPQTPVENAIALVEMVHELSQ